MEKKLSVLDIFAGPHPPKKPIKQDDAKLAAACIQSATAFLLNIGVTYAAVLQALTEATGTIQKQQADDQKVRNKATKQQKRFIPPRQS